MHEAGYHEHTSFLTTTFAELPIREELNKKHVQLFLKRIRKEIAPRKVKYFACGQYGESEGRPHYHYILFGEDEETLAFNPAGKTRKVIYGDLESWPFGTSYFGTATRQSAAYVASYMQADTRAEYYEGRTPPFGLKSNGLGKQYALDNKERLCRNLSDTFYGVPVALPRQYRVWMDLPTEEWQAHGKEKHEERYRELIRKYGHDPSRIGEEKRRHLDQHDLNLLALQELRRDRKNVSVHSVRHGKDGNESTVHG